jgi:hypothetical protein
MIPRRTFLKSASAAAISASYRRQTTGARVEILTRAAGSPGMIADLPAAGTDRNGDKGFTLEFLARRGSGRSTGVGVNAVRKWARTLMAKCRP